MLELTVNQQPAIIDTNFEAVKENLTASIQKYKNLVVTEEGLKEAKADQLLLSKLETKIDTYRKTVKQEIEKPIKDFESKCKILTGLVSEARIPLKAGIEVFDEAEREKKKLIAAEHIKTVVVDLLLNEKYSAKLTVLDSYGNVSLSIKKLKEDIEKRGYSLKQEQQQEADNLQIIKDTIENVNKTIDAKIDIEDFRQLIKSESMPVVLQNINARVGRIKANELKAIADKAAAAEKEVLERIAKAEREAAEKVRIEERNIRIAKEEVEYAEKMKLKAIDEAKISEKHKEELRLKVIEDAERIESEKVISTTIKEETSAPVEEKMYFINMRVEGNAEKIQALSKFLKENNYNYEAISKGLL